MRATRIIDLPVRVASHTGRLAEASVVFREVLRSAPVAFPSAAGARILSGIDGGSVVSAETGHDKLAAQISQTVQWGNCLQSCLEAGATAFLEFGPGHALSRMVASIEPGLPVRSLDDFRSLQGVRNWLARHLSD
jgi:[acyl-carrier-protein] S-malonyltransferase